MFVIKLADLYIEIDNRFDHVERFCRGYIAEGGGSVDFAVSVSDDDLKKESELAQTAFSDGALECTAVYRKICTEILRYDAFFIHSSVVAVDGAAYAFAARSGTGKSTHASLWLKRFGNRAFIVNGDKPIMRFTGKGLTVYGTPWCGKEGMNTNTSVPLKALCFLQRGEVNIIRRASQRESIDRIFGQLLIPRDKQSLSAMLDLTDRLVREIPMYLLECDISDEAVNVSFNGMNKL